MGIVNSVNACLRGTTTGDSYTTLATYSDSPEVQAKADAFVSALLTAEKPGDIDRELAQFVNPNAVGTSSWWEERFAQAVLDVLTQALSSGVAAALVAKDAIDKSVEAAVGFAKEHPVYFTLIALGVLVLLSPWIIEALGFGELGPIEGTVAAMWQARYAGYVPKGSLFSFFQRLGMIWRRFPAKY